jgi:ABC-type polysaccharide/polyol phosphate transport system ATPase subunit
VGEPRIEFRSVGKSFRLRNRSDSLRDALARAFRGGGSGGPETRFTALDGVTFAVSPGEVVGIVGPNGSGKSTSLRLAAGVYRPDAGEVVVRGRVSAMIELSAGFHPDLSGRENIYLAGALLGLRRREVDQVFDRIIEFADIGGFIESPVHMYSSGMAVRLGFAVAAHVPADVLLVDEVLAVGDLDFQTKCLRRMAERRSEGVSLIFVSHNLAVVEQFCDRVIFLHHGKVLVDAAPREAIDRYRRLVAEEHEEPSGRGNLFPNRRSGTGEVLLDEVRVVGDPSLPPGCAAHGGSLRISGRWTAAAACARPILGVAIHTTAGALVGESSGAAAGDLAGQGRFEVALPRVDLLPGEYEVSVYVKDHAGLMVLDRHLRLYPLRVVGPSPAGEHGVVPLGGAWTVGGGKG